MSDDLRAAEAHAALLSMQPSRIEYKSNVESAGYSVDGREVTTVFSVDCLDSVGDLLPVSAFRTSLQGKAERIPHLWMHDVMAPPIAVIRAFHELKRADLPADVQAGYPDATGGVACTSRFLTTTRANEIFDGFVQGVPFQASIGYSVVKSTPHRSQKTTEGKPARVLNEIRLYEVSTTQPNHAAQPATRAWVNKVLALLEEIKLGARHSAVDMSSLTHIAEVLMGLGVPITFIQRTADAAPESPVGTSDVDALLSDIASIYEVAL